MIGKVQTRHVWAGFWLGLLTYELTVLVGSELGWASRTALLTPVGIAFLSGHFWAGYVLGVLIGHFVLLRRGWMPWPRPPPWGLFPLLTLLALFMPMDFLVHLHLRVEASVAGGAVLGHAFWAQDPPAQAA